MTSDDRAPPNKVGKPTSGETYTSRRASAGAFFRCAGGLRDAKSDVERRYSMLERGKSSNTTA